MVVLLPRLTVYASPDNCSEQVDELLFGDRIRVENFGFHCKITTDYGYSGYVLKRGFEQCDFVPNYRVSVPFADLLGQDYYRFSAALSLPFGACVYAEETKNPRFCRVYAGKKKLFIHKNHLMPLVGPDPSQQSFRRDVLSKACRYLGVQYRWGGRTHLGIDCSGLCFNAYRFCGVDIWRDAVIEKSHNLRKIGYSQAKEGDLLFFEGHVAIKDEGNFIIHSSASAGGVVREDFLKNTYLKNIFTCAGTLF